MKHLGSDHQYTDNTSVMEDGTYMVAIDAGNGRDADNDEIPCHVFFFFLVISRLLTMCPGATASFTAVSMHMIYIFRITYKHILCFNEKKRY